MAKKSHKAPFETSELRKSLTAFFNTAFQAADGVSQPIGSYKWGVYVFYDYDGEPIYVGQTKERVSGRIGRHLTNQRTDAVAMSVLDPFEVFEIEVFPLPQFERVNSKSGAGYKNAKSYLDALEYAVHQKAIKESKFRAILNEKDPPEPTVLVEIPKSLKGKVVSPSVEQLRAHPDTRIARRAQIVARLAQTISERKVQNGLRRTLVTQATRLHSLAQQQFADLGGQATVEKAPEEAETENQQDGV